MNAMSPRARIADAGLDAVLGITLGVGSLTLLVVGLAIDLSFKGRNALRRPAPPVK
jgi:hypothetical protein